MAFLLLGIMALAGCDGSDHRNMVVVESPDAVAIQINQSQFEEGSQSSVVVVDPSRTGTPTVSPSRISWSTSDAAVVTVEGGVLHARGQGQATITARSGAAEATASVSVVRTPDGLVISREGEVEGEVGQRLDWPLEAQVVSSQGRPIQGAEVRFKVVSGSGVVSPVIATTAEDGIARTDWTLGGTAGEQRVQVEVLDTRVESRVVNALANPGPAHEILVTPAEVKLNPGSAVQFDARIVDVFGNRVGEVDVMWESTDPDIARVTEDGWVTGLQSGEASIEAEPIGGTSVNFQAIMSELAASSVRGNGNARVHVQSEEEGGSEATVAVMGGNYQTGRVGETLPAELEMRITDAGGRPVRQTDVNWIVSHGAASIAATSGRTDGQGRASATLALGTTPGEVMVTADLGDLGSAVFYATAEVGSLAEVRLTPASASIEVVEELSFTTTAFDEYGNEIRDYPAPSWTVADSKVASVSSQGLAKGEAAGTTGVRASVEGVSGTASLEVQATSGGDDGSDGGTDDGSSGGSDGGDGGTQTASDPAKVTDLQVVGTTESTATLRFTQVDDGTGEPAQYHMRWHLHPIEWGWGQASYASGSCADPIRGDQIGTALTCTVEVLDPDTKLDFQLVSFRVEDGRRVFSPLSNVATGSTAPGDDSTGSSGAQVATVQASQSSVNFTALEASVTLSAEALDESGVVVSGESFDWTSTNAGVATVNQAGTIVAKAVGTALVVVSATCCEAAVSDTVSIFVEQVPASVQVDPSSVLLDVGASQQLVASVNDSNDFEINGSSVTWSSSDPNVVEVTSDGFITGKDAGSASVIARHDVYQSTSSIEVTSDSNGGGDGGDGSTGTTPIFDEDFSNHSSVEGYLNTLNSRGWVIQEGRMAFDSDGFGGSSQSLRYDFPDMSGDVDRRCNNTTIGHTVDLRPMVDDEKTDLKDVWIEVWYKFSDNWNPAPADEWNCSPSSPDYKMIFGQVLGGGDRFSFKHGWQSSASMTFYYPEQGAAISHPGAAEQWDGNWYRMRMRMKLSSSPDVADGMIQGWIGDEMVRDTQGVVINRDMIYGIALGRNRNHGATEDMSVYFGSLRVWIDNPGW